MPEASLIHTALESIGVDSPTWKTMVIYASEETDYACKELWDVWTQLENWPNYSPLFESTRWIGEPGWKSGAIFEQTLILGFPVGTIRSRETVGEFEAGRCITWTKEKNGIKSKHVWLFEPLPDGGTRITNFEVFHGALVGLMKPLVRERWTRLFKASVEGIINAVSEKGADFRVKH